MSDIAYIGEIRLFGFDWAPRDWALCHGQLLSINDNTTLYSLIGTRFGGNGRTTFALPDLRGRVAVHQGQAPGLNNYMLGQKSGMEMVQLTVNEMPSHTHNPQSSNQPGNQQSPNNGVCADETNETFSLYQSAADGVMLPTTAAGGNQAHDNMQPYLVANYCICMNGIYPSRS
ncbi:microcystin-dependent protein [Shimia isoporae]|uniref:Microcystin-dependent protein n=1 Tax=Shimia isoporae TaxID=647720 RepID=A0A4R1NJX4_9RHOB|nr:tail fiber protein [Shimia isoporae]TCL08596.1 microcystin-dependent protein [Shimia isoporae]